MNDFSRPLRNSDIYVGDRSRELSKGLVTFIVDRGCLTCREVGHGSSGPVYRHTGNPQGVSNFVSNLDEKRPAILRRCENRGLRHQIWRCATGRYETVEVEL